MNMIRPLKKKKEIGAFYTPSGVARILSNWAIRSSEDNILEPSFGGCGFLEASRDRLLNIGCENMANQIYGCDIDRYAFDQLTSKFGLLNVSNRFLLGDFLQVTPQNFSVQEFDVVLGNPPYISHHNMTITQKENAHAILNETSYKLSTKASLWAYFVIHAINFVKKGGRMAWVLPGSFLNSKYGNDVHSILVNNFENISSIVLNERIFLSEGAEERSIIVLCEDKGVKSKHGIQIHYANSISSLYDCICSNILDATDADCRGKATYRLLSIESRQVLDQLFMRNELCALGDFANIKIGIVTGDNQFFIVNKQVANMHQLSSSLLKPIVSKFRMISGLTLTENDINNGVISGAKCLLVDTTKMRKNSRTLLAYLDSYPKEKLEMNKTFSKRKIWHRADDGRIPDAFLSYMQHNGPRLALNKAGTTCTNSVHRVYFKNISKHIQKIAAISCLSTLTQISAEIEGRSYGSGVLKQEPSEAREIKICLFNHLSIKEVNALYKCIDELLRLGKEEDAKFEADKAVNACLGITEMTATLLDDMLVQLRKMRQR